MISSPLLPPSPGSGRPAGNLQERCRSICPCKRESSSRILAFTGSKVQVEEIAAKFHGMGSVVPDHVVVQFVVVVLRVNVLRRFAQRRKTGDGHIGITRVQWIGGHSLQDLSAPAKLVPAFGLISPPPTHIQPNRSFVHPGWAEDMAPGRGKIVGVSSQVVSKRREQRFVQRRRSERKKFVGVENRTCERKHCRSS